MKSPYVIRYSGLKTGVHHFTFEVGDAFFGTYEQSPVQQGKVLTKVTLDRRPDMLVFDFALSGTVRAVCDRCSEEFDLPLKGKDQLLVKFSDSTEDQETDETEIIFLPKTEMEIDLAQFLYELIVLSLPIKKTHPVVKGQPTCDPAIMRFFSQEPEEDDEEAPKSSVWDVLKGLDLDEKA